MVKLSWSEQGSADLEEIYRYLSRESGKQTAANIYKRIRNSTKRLIQQPESCPFYLDPIRRLVIKGLPYSLYYEFCDDTVNILAVRHEKRTPLDSEY